MSDDSSTGFGRGPRDLPVARGLEIRQAGSEAVELGFDRGPVVAGGRVAPQRLADQGERGGRTSNLVLGARDLLRVGHSASVSL